MSEASLEEIQREMTGLQAEFGDIVDCAYDQVFKKNVPGGLFFNRLKNLPIERREIHEEFLDKVAEKFDKDTTMDKVWFQLTNYWNFLNFFLLEQVICKFGDADLKAVMVDYLSKLKAFRCRTRLCDFAKCSAKISRNLSEDDFNLLATKLNQSWEECTLEDLENLREKFTHKFFLPSFALTLKEIKPGCIHVTWSIPAVIGSSLKVTMKRMGMREFCEEQGIMLLRIENSFLEDTVPGMKQISSGEVATSLSRGSNNQLVLKGQACIQAAKTAYNLIYTQKDTKKAIECLSVLKEDAKLLQSEAEKSKEKGAAKERELEEEIDRLTKEKDGYDLTVSRLNKERRDEEYKLSQQRQTLSNAELDLHDARSLLSDAETELRRAKEKEKVAMTTAVTTGVVVGMFTFGIGGAAVAGAAAAGITALVHEIQGKVNKAKDKIRSRENDVSRAQSAISSSQQALSNIQCKISDYNGRIATTERRMKEVHDKISENKPTLAVHRQALELWELFAQASENVAEMTQRLENIIQKANKKQNLKIVRSNGTIKIAESVVEAWEEISFHQGRITMD